MAEAIIKQWKLAVLRVTLDLSGPAPMVRSTLDGFSDGEEVHYWERSDPLAGFGLDLSGQIPRTVRVPRAVQQAVTRSMRTDLPSQSALWIRLEPPYGFLGAAPWESLAEKIHVPVLRVPDRLPVAAQLGDTWHITMIVSNPGRARWGASHVRGFVGALSESVAANHLGAFDVDVFPNLTVYRQLAGDDMPANVRVHDPEDYVREPRTRPAANRVSGTRRIDSDSDPRLAWAEWITSCLGSQASSALHVAAQGVASNDRSMLQMSADPAHAQSQRMPATADANDLWSLADVIGASLVSIAAPEKDGSDVGARMVADRLGQLRPGATIFSSMRQDPGCGALARVHSFLAMQRQNELPDDTSWFGYIQPESIQHTLAAPLLPRYTNQAALPEPTQIALMGRVAAESEPFAPTAPISASLYGKSDVPRWAASSSRFIETRFADISNSITRTATSAPRDAAYEMGASKALADIQSLVQQHLGEQS
jgi:hypothetical protein